jgi:hypothetical protein
LMRLWCTFLASRLFACSFPEYFKLAKTAMVIGGQNVLPEVLHYVEFSVCGSIQAVVGRTSLI